MRFRICRLLAGCLALGLAPAAAEAAPLDETQFKEVIATARAYVADRKVLFYCLRHKAETVSFLFLGLHGDLTEALRRLKAAGGDDRQSGELALVVLANSWPSTHSSQEPARDAECTAKNAETSLKQGKGAALPLGQRPPFDKFGR